MGRTPNSSVALPGPPQPVSIDQTFSIHSTNAEDAHLAGRRALLMPEEKLQVLEWYRSNGRNQKATAAHFRALPRYEKLSQGTISRWLAAEKKIRAAMHNSREGILSPTRSCHTEKNLKHPELEKCLTRWLENLDSEHYDQLTGNQIKSTAREIYDELAVPAAERLELSNGWLSRFQIRHGIKLQRNQREDLQESMESVRVTECKRVADTIAVFSSGVSAGSACSLDDVWCLDRAPFFFECSPVKEVQNTVASPHTAELVVGLASNVTGTQRLEPIFVRSDNPLKPLHFRSEMEPAVLNQFSAWLQNWNQALVRSNRHVLLLVNKSFNQLAGLTEISNIRLVFLSPVLMDHVRSCCGKVTKVFHVQYRQLVIQHALSKLTSGMPIFGTHELFEVNSVDAMALAKIAWQAGSSELAASCWRKTQVLPTQINGVGVPSQLEADASFITVVDEEVAKLNQLLQMLELEAHSRSIPLQCVSGAEFSRLGIEPPSPTALSIKQIVYQVQQERSSGPTKAAECTEEDPHLPNPIQPVFAPPPNVILQAQEILEQYWTQHNFPLPAAVVEFLQQSRAQLQHQVQAASTSDQHGYIA